LPEASLLVVGSGPFEDALKSIASGLGLHNKVTFAGHVFSKERLTQMISKCAVGLAPYVPTSYEPYAFPSKALEYMSCGLPVILTGVQTFAQMVAERKAGIVISYDEDQLVEAIRRLLSDDTLYIEYRNNAIKLAENYMCDRLFMKAFARMVNKVGLQGEGFGRAGA